MYGRYEIVEVPIEKGASPNLKCEHLLHDDEDGFAIWYAIQHRNLEILKLLVAKGARPDKQDPQFVLRIMCDEIIALLSRVPYEVY
ncbi:Ankyrin repeat protein [Penicillium fimorum]|uniref:Ankyrin repeat protein n=1 Tax=Penicillium fimorum TaxID=1882269 RepID=A0A9W9Y6D6_9EURO|nr:Ankyrin repeat protein [Penicillium fimorum]